MKRRIPKKPPAKRPHKGRKHYSLPNPNKVTRKAAPGKKTPPSPNDPRERALVLMKGGVSQAAAAKSVGISTQRLARYRRATTTSKIKGRKWVIRDHRPAEMYIVTNGKVIPIAVPYRGKSAIGHYWNAVNEFLTDNDISHLESFAGRAIRDINRKKYIFEVGPNTLRMLDAIGELNFVQIYASVAN
jgi:hypothetical protein